MASGEDCSYNDSNNTFHQYTCPADKLYCCNSGNARECSASSCDDGGGETTASILSTYAFWLILAGVAVFGVIVLTVTYLICRNRKPGHGLDHRKSIFEETLSQTGRDRQSSARPSLPEFRLQTESRLQVTHQPIRVMSRNTNVDMTGSPLTETRWTLANGFTARHMVSKRTDSREEILKSKDVLPNVQS